MEGLRAQTNKPADGQPGDAPLVEKGPQLNRTATALETGIVLSMKRLVVLMFAVVVAQQVGKFGIRSWPEATVAIMVIAVLPFMAAMDRLGPEDAARAARGLVDRLSRLAERINGVATVRPRAAGAA